MKKIYFSGMCLLAVFLLSSGAAQAVVRYVKTNGTGSGGSWSTAYGSVQAAVTAASSGDSVFVAAGTYTLTADVTLKDGVQLLGGFVGTETSSTQRVRVDADGNGLVEPWEYKNATVLQGNKTKRILTQAAVFASPTLVDGFTLKNGKEVNGGGANLKGGAILKACIINGNEATADGGGAYLSGATMLACLVKDNVYAVNGGGVYAGASSSVHGCKIVNNTSGLAAVNVKVGDELGGGIVFSVNEVARAVQVVSLTKSTEMAWSGAATWCSGLNVGGQTGWALPTSAQLQQIYIVNSILNTALSAAAGAQVLGTGAYWSSTESGSQAGAVFFDTGYAGNMVKTNITNSVRAVRTISF